MNEDDTFKKLKQISYEEMISRGVDYIHKNGLYSNTVEFREYMKTYGWTKEELDTEWTKRNPRGPHG